MEESTIYMNYRQAVNQAERLQEQAERLSRVANGRMGDTMTRLSTNWKGENADAYLAKCAALQDKMTRTARDLSAAAAAIRAAAERTYKADMRALELARQRNYGG